MEARWMLIASGIILFSSFAFSFYLTSTSGLSPGIQCNSLSYNSENAINILFFSTEKEAEKYSEFFLSKEPLSSNIGAFNFYYTDYEPSCSLYEDIALFCHSRELLEVASNCPHDYIVVIEEDSPSIRSSAYQNVMSINSAHSLSVFHHEFGHSFANLAEEYVPASLSFRQKNCVNSCEDFGSEECFQGCSSSEYYRSIEEGVMRTLSPQEEYFGGHNEELISKLLPQNPSKTITSNAIAPITECSKQSYLLVEGQYEDAFKINSLSLKNGCAPTKSGAGEISLNVLKGQSIINSLETNHHLFTDAPFSDNNELTGEIFSISQFTTIIPYLSGSSTLQISDGEIVLTETSLENLNSIPCIK